jgi:hypothetical protein
VSRRAGVVLAAILALAAVVVGTWVILGRRDSSGPHGSLTARESSLATATAKHLQAEVTGTFIGATAFASHGRVHPFSYDQGCPNTRLVHLRLVWKDDANFTHGAVAGAPRDGPRKAWLVTVDPHTGHVCQSGAKYRDVGAAPRETLLYGNWPHRLHQS